MRNEIQLDGGEITIVKALGTSGGEMSGETLMEKVGNMVAAEMIDVLKGLIMQGYVEADKRSFYNEAELKAVNFCVNSGYSRELKDALDPRPKEKVSRRVRRE